MSESANTKTVQLCEPQTKNESKFSDFLWIFRIPNQTRKEEELPGR